MDPKSKVYWTKALFGVALGIICPSLGLYGPNGWIGLVLGFVVLVIVHYLTIYVYKLNVREMGGQGRIAINGILPYLALWIMIWTLLNTLFFV